MNYNIITIKWGTKYKSDHPNKIYKDCKEKCSFDFKFYCITDDATGIDPEILILNMPTHSDLNYNDYIKSHLDRKTLMWDRPKLYMFTDFDFKGTNIFLDLDAEVKEDLVYLTTLPNDKPWIVDMWWKTNWRENWDKLWNGRVNTSVMVWQDNQCEFVTQTILKNAKENFNRYSTVDTFIGYELVDYDDYNNTRFHFLPPFVVCSGKRFNPKNGEYKISLWSNSPGAWHGGIPEVPGVD
jgi:hypothetical protein